MTAALEIRELYHSFGALQVARGISLELPLGARHALIGPNGAGKTTLVNLISGALRTDKGSVFVQGRDVTGLSQAARVKSGVARTFQINQLFRGLTVFENVVLSVTERQRKSSVLFRRLSRDAGVIEEAMELLRALRLEEDALKTVQELPYGRQRLVEIAITLAQRPGVLLLDEPAAGVPSTESHIILDVLETLPADMAILIIEHDMDVVFRFAHRVTVLVNGSVLVEGEPDEIAADTQVRAVYLGERIDG